MIRRLKNQKGLTLVELLAVIVILGIIAGIAVPSIGKIIDNSKRDAAIANALQVINATNLAIASGIDSSTIKTAEDIKDFIEPFPDPFKGDPIQLNKISIDTTGTEAPYVNLVQFGCKARSGAITDSNTNVNKKILTLPNARDYCPKL